MTREFNRPGDFVGAFPTDLTMRANEKVICALTMTNLPLMGQIIRGMFEEYLMRGSDHSTRMEANDGFLGAIIVPTEEILAVKNCLPGDLDLLLIRHRQGNPVFEDSFSIEVKVLRMNPERQSKTTNEFGISQCRGMISLGFPYVGLLHVIIREEAHEGRHKNIMVARVLDKNGNVKIEPSIRRDISDWETSARQFGRLSKLTDNVIGLSVFSAELTLDSTSQRLKDYAGEAYFSAYTVPHNRQGSRNLATSKLIPEGIRKYFFANERRFINMKWS